MGNVIEDWIEAVLNLIYPRSIKCMLCENELFDKEPYSLCETCLSNLYFLNNAVCNCCGRLLGEMATIEICIDCKEEMPLFEKNISVVLYNEISKKLIYQLKYGDARYVAYHLGTLMSEKLELEQEIKSKVDFIIPVPISNERIGERGFNQATLIAEFISERAGLEVKEDLVKRVKHTPPQTKLNRLERKENLKDVFKVVEPEMLLGKNVLIVDDVITTGTTINEIAKELIKMGAYEVYGLTFAAPTTR